MWPKRAAEAVAAVAVSPVPDVQASESWPSGSATVYDLTTGARVSVAGVYDYPVPRSLALSVPAILRGVTLKCTTVAALPIERVAPDGTRVDLGWVEQPEAGRPRFQTFNDIGFDLELSGRSYLRILARDASGAPKRGGCEYIPLNRIGDITLSDGRRSVTIDAKPVNPTDVIGFEGWHDGILNHGARTIRTALALEAASRRYADNPSPSQVLVNQSDDDLLDEEITELLEGFKGANNTEAVRYLNKMVKLEQVGFDPKSLQLVEARQFLNTLLANLIGVPAWAIAGAQAADGGSVYANVGQENRSLIDYGAKFLATAIESRLSLSDVTGQAWTNQVTPRGTIVRFKMDGLLRGNPLERAQLYTLLVPLGILTVEEARAMEDLAPQGRTPA